MKTRKKGIIFFALVAGIMLASGITIAVPGFISGDDDLEVFVAGDGYTDEERPQFCGTNDKPKSTDFVIEYKIPTPCTQPLAITTEPNGTVWFAETNTGNLGKFDPVTETFTEYTNSRWVAAESELKQKLRSMMWGMDYSPDGAIWYTDEATDSIWRFSIADEKYNTLNFPMLEGEESIPQKLLVEGSDVIVNDFSGGKLTFFGYSQLGELTYSAIPSPIDGFTGDFAIDLEDNIWYTNWRPEVLQYENSANTGTGILLKFDRSSWESQLTISPEADSLLLQDFIQFFQFPSGMTTPNGVAIGSDQNIWIVDTSSSYFFSFDPVTEEYTKYVTSVPTIDSYGNASGFIKSPISRPYWIEQSGNNLIMNEQTANRIAVFNPSTETLVEYTIPSRNPNWSDCEGITYCGVAQVFDFAIDGKKIWFTEWVENNIGVVDTSISLPFSVDTDTQSITLEKGQTANVSLLVMSEVIETGTVTVNLSTTSLFSDLVITSEPKELYLDDSSKTVSIQISASDSALPGTHKVLLGAYNNEIAVSQFITVTIV